MRLTPPESTFTWWSRALSVLKQCHRGRLFKRLILVALSLFFVLLSTFGYLVYSTYGYALPYLVDRFVRQFQNSALLPIHYASSYIHPLFNEELETIYIDVPFENWQKVEAKAQEALQVGILISSSDDYVKATISSSKGGEYKTKIRLKGDWLDHLDLDKPSLRVKIRNSKSWNGLSTFSMQSPKTRNFLGEWLLFKALRDENILAPRYEFIDAILNGKSIGVMATSEFFTKELVESMGRRDSIIFKYNEDFLWDDRATHMNVLEKETVASTLLFGHDDILHNPATLEPFELNDIQEDPQKAQWLQSAYALLEEFDQENMSFCDVFDCEQYARYFSLQTLFGAEHGNFWHNERFYYNPITSHFEPISFDNYAVQRSTGVLLGIVDFRGLIYYALQDERFSPLYQSELWRVSQENYVETLWSHYEPQLRHLQGFLWREFPFTNIKDIRHTIDSNAYSIRSLFNPPQFLHARFEARSLEEGLDHLEIQLGNFVPLALTIHSVEVDEKLFPMRELQQCGTTNYFDEFQLSPTLYLAPPNYQSICLDIASTDTPHNVEVHFSISGTDFQETVAGTPLTPSFPKNRVLESNANIESFPFIIKDTRSKTVTISSGSWDLNDDLIIPSGYTLKAEPGARLRLAPSVSIYSYAPLEFIGTESSPIIIEALNPEEPWGVFIVLNGDSPSTLEHVQFSGGSQQVNDTYNLTGGVTFFRSNVNMDNVTIQDMHGEDGLNIVESEFALKSVTLARTFSDAFDGDFSKGTIEDITFLDIGNDSIDVSGTVIEINDLLVRGTGDKGVSAGEGSTVTLTGATIVDAFIGLTSKDLSSLTASDVNLANTYFDLAAYTKKSEFGASSLSLTTDKTISTDQMVVHEGSTVYLNDVLLPPNRNASHDVFAEMVETNPNL